MSPSLPAAALAGERPPRGAGPLGRGLGPSGGRRAGPALGLLRAGAAPWTVRLGRGWRGLAGRRRCGRRVVGSAAAGASRGRRFLASAPSVRGGCLCLLLTGIGLRGCERCLSFSVVSLGSPLGGG